MKELSGELQELLKKGYNRLDSGKNCEPTEQFQKYRVTCRRWRNLVGEARFDIPECLHSYIDWTLPTEWKEKGADWVSFHQFVINIPDFFPILVIYRKYVGSSDWYFYEFKIIISETQKVCSNRYVDLPLFLAMASELKRPKKHKVVLEEIEGDLASNAHVVKLKDTNIIKKVLTEFDFLNNPDMDMDRASDDGMPMCIC